MAKTLHLEMYGKLQESGHFSCNCRVQSVQNNFIKEDKHKNIIYVYFNKKKIDFAIQHHLPEEPALEMFFSPAWPTQCTHYTVQPWRNDVKLHYYRTSY